jgi:hypothetical protein
MALIAALALAPAALAQLGPASASIVYIQVQPMGMGEVAWLVTTERLSSWPTGGIPVSSFFTISYPQGGYLYLEARPYGCAELEGWEVTPEDANWTYMDSRERIILHLDRDYIAVKAVFRQIPEEKCPYIVVWKTIRVRKDAALNAAVITCVLGLSGATAYTVRRRAAERRRREREFWERMRRARNTLLLERIVDPARPIFVGPWQAIMYTCLAEPGLLEAGPERLRTALLDDAELARLRRNQVERRNIGDCYLLDARSDCVKQIPLLGLKTYLALYNLAPSTDEITKIYLASLDPHHLPTLWHESNARHEIGRMLAIIAENMDLQRRGLEPVMRLMREDPEYARRIREPPEYFAEILRWIEEWARENLGIAFRGLRLAREAAKPRPEEAIREAKPQPPPPPPPPRPKEAERPPAEELAEEPVKGPREEELPDKVPFPDWLADALDYWERMRREEEERVWGIMAGIVVMEGVVAVGRVEEGREPQAPSARRVFRMRKGPEKGIRIIHGLLQQPKEAPRPERPAIRPEKAEEKPEEIIEAKPKEVEARPERAEAPVSWDELPAPLQRQIEGLGLTLEETASIALKTMGRGEKDVYREANRLLSEKYPDMGEQDMISALMTAVNAITWLQSILEEKGVKPGEEAKPAEGAASQAVEERPERAPEGVKPEEAAKPVEHVEEERMEEARVEETEEVEKGVEEVKEQPAVTEATITAAPKEVEIYNEVKVDRVEVSRPPIRVAAQELYLIDVLGASLSWVPTSLIAEMFHGCKPITFERRRHYSKDVVEELFITLKKMCMIGGTIPLIVVGRPGHTSTNEEDMRARIRNTTYIDKLRQLLRMLREAKVGRYAVAMPFQVYKQYCRNIQELQAMRKIVYVIDVDGIAQELSGRIPDGALPHLRIAASISPALLQDLRRSPRQVTWRPSAAEATGEEEALAWAVRTIYSKGGPLTVEEVDRAGYRDYLDRLIVLGMVERG